MLLLGGYAAMDGYVTLAEVGAQLDALVAWLGNDRIRAALPVVSDDTAGLQRSFAGERQWIARDLLVYVYARDADAVTEELVMHKLAPLCRLASAATCFGGLEVLPGRFKGLLLGDACADHVFEIIAAAEHQRRGFSIRWLPEHGGGGEFAARIGDGPEIFVECKRLAADVVEILRTNEVSLIADALMERMREAGVGGHLSVHIGPDLVGRPQLAVVLNRLAMTLRPGCGRVEEGDISIDFDLKAGADASMTYEDLIALNDSSAEVYRCIAGRRAGPVVHEVRVIEFNGPKHDGDWFARKIETVCGRAADAQLRPDHPGVIFLELPMFRGDDPHDVLQIAAEKIVSLFERAHIIGLHTVVALTRENLGNGIGVNAPARLLYNANTCYQEAMQEWRDRMAH